MKSKMHIFSHVNLSEIWMDLIINGLKSPLTSSSEGEVSLAWSGAVSFRNSCISNVLNGTEDDVLYENLDTSTHDLKNDLEGLNFVVKTFFWNVLANIFCFYFF